MKIVSSQLKKSILSLLSLVLIISLLAPSASLAGSQDNILNRNIDPALIEKADPYVYLDAKSESFKLQKNAKSTLTKQEIKEVEKILKESNKQVKQFRDDLVLNLEENKFDSNIQSNLQAETNDEISTMAIDKKKHFDWDFTWWGLKVYWSHTFVNKLKSNLAIYGGGVAALNATIAYFLSPPGWVTSFVAAVAGIGVGVFITRDKGCGVYLDCYLYVPTAWYSAC